MCQFNSFKESVCADCNASTVWGMVGWCEGVVYLTSPGRPTDIGLQLGKAAILVAGKG